MPDFFWPMIILLLAMALLCLEVFIPSGGVLSVCSACAFIAAIVVAFIKGGVALGTTCMATVGILVPIMLFVVVKWWPKTAIGRRILIQPPSEEELIPLEVQSMRELIGQQGMAVTPMLPSGAVRLGKQTIDAVSDGRSIEKGTLIEVVAAKGNHLVVRPFSPNSATTDEPKADSMESIVPDPFDDSLS